MHIVHYSSAYDSTTEEGDKNVGLAVLGFFFEVQTILSSEPGLQYHEIYFLE